MSIYYFSIFSIPYTPYVSYTLVTFLFAHRLCPYANKQCLIETIGYTVPTTYSTLNIYILYIYIIYIYIKSFYCAPYSTKKIDFHFIHPYTYILNKKH